MELLSIQLSCMKTFVQQRNILIMENIQINCIPTVFIRIDKKQAKDRYNHMNDR